MLYRSKYYDSTSTTTGTNELTELIIAKQRNGPTGNVKLQFDEKRTKFLNLNCPEADSNC